MTSFNPHTTDTAPEQSRAGLYAAQRKFGFIPNMIGVLAESPAALEAYQAIGAIFEKSGFSAGEQAILALAVSVENGCDYCVPAYTGLAVKADVDEAVIEAVRDGGPIADARFSALRDFADQVVAERGLVTDAQVDAFLAAGFTKAQVLEVIVAAAFKLISNYTNHVADVPLDEPFKPFHWDGRKAA
ncbi:MAG: carboxymuconolactone decarboxylase family protein [Rhodospirillales bacterium]